MTQLDAMYDNKHFGLIFCGWMGYDSLATSLLIRGRSCPSWLQSLILQQCHVSKCWSNMLWQFDLSQLWLRTSLSQRDASLFFPSFVLCKLGTSLSKLITQSSVWELCSIVRCYISNPKPPTIFETQPSTSRRGIVCTDCRSYK